jgi:hypothetical protein
MPGRNERERYPWERGTNAGSDGVNGTVLYHSVPLAWRESIHRPPFPGSVVHSGKADRRGVLDAASCYLSVG